MIGAARRAESASAAPAPLLRRLAALSYEGLLLTAVILIVGFLIMPLVSPTPAATHSLQVPDLPARVIAFCAVFAAGALYFAWSWSGGRRTLPMKTWHMAVVRADGSPPHRAGALSRRVDRTCECGRRLPGLEARRPWRACGVAHRPQLRVGVWRPRPSVSARSPCRDPRGGCVKPESRNRCSYLSGRASATPTAINPIPENASASSVSPNISHAATAVTAGTRKKSRATLAAAPWRSSQ
ncbi:MAG: hypothetical protein GZ089_12485 [Aromatoleum sp.]|nr:hypothetical protein [Aromatoleum sp.]